MELSKKKEFSRRSSLVYKGYKDLSCWPVQEWYITFSGSFNEVCKYITFGSIQVNFHDYMAQIFMEQYLIRNLQKALSRLTVPNGKKKRCNSRHLYELSSFTEERGTTSSIYRTEHSCNYQRKTMIGNPSNLI